jgi:hypothetical protein
VCLSFFRNKHRKLEATEGINQKFQASTKDLLSTMHSRAIDIPRLARRQLSAPGCIQEHALRIRLEGPLPAIIRLVIVKAGDHVAM